MTDTAADRLPDRGGAAVKGGQDVPGRGSAANTVPADARRPLPAPSIPPAQQPLTAAQSCRSRSRPPSLHRQRACPGPQAFGMGEVASIGCDGEVERRPHKVHAPRYIRRSSEKHQMINVEIRPGVSMARRLGAAPAERTLADERPQLANEVDKLRNVLQPKQTTSKAAYHRQTSSSNVWTSGYSTKSKNSKLSRYGLTRMVGFGLQILGRLLP